MSEEEQYQEYLRGLRETNDGKPSVQQLMQQNLATEGDINRGIENAASMMTGGLGTAIPKVWKTVAAALEGGLLGAAQSPDDRLAGFLTGGATQGGVSGVGSLLGKVGGAVAGGIKASGKQGAYNDAVRAGTSGEFLQQGAEDAAGKLRGQISQGEKNLRGALSPDGYTVNPDLVAKTFPNYAKRLAARRTDTVTTPIDSSTKYLDEVTQPGLGMQSVSRVERDLPSSETLYNEALTQGQLPLTQPVVRQGSQAQLPKGQQEMFAGPAQASMPYDELSGQVTSRQRAVNAANPSEQFAWQQQHGLPLKQVTETRTPMDAPESFGNLSQVEQYGLPLTQTRQVPAPQGRVNISPAQTRRLWKATNQASDFSPSDIMNPTAKAKSDEALALGDSIRREVYGKTPGAQQIMEQMGSDIQAKNYLSGKAVKRNPQTALSPATLGTNKIEKLMGIDQRVGSDLAEAGQRMSKARDLSKPLDVTKPLESALRVAERGAYSVAGSNVVQGTGRKIQSLKELLQGMKIPRAVQQSTVETDEDRELAEYNQYLKEMSGR